MDGWLCAGLSKTKSQREWERTAILIYMSRVVHLSTRTKTSDTSSFDKGLSTSSTSLFGSLSDVIGLSSSTPRHRWTLFSFSPLWYLYYDRIFFLYVCLLSSCQRSTLSLTRQFSFFCLFSLTATLTNQMKRSCLIFLSIKKQLDRVEEARPKWRGKNVGIVLAVCRV